MTDEIQNPSASSGQAENVPREQYLRLAADFENYKRAMEKQLTEIAKFGGQSVVLQMVDVLDLLDTALAHAPPDTPPEWFKGLQQVGKRFTETMEKQGVRRIGTEGKAFDPATMEAVSMVAGPGEGSPGGTSGGIASGESQQVKEEVRAGYTLHDRVIRPARVIIYE